MKQKQDAMFVDFFANERVHYYNVSLFTRKNTANRLNFNVCACRAQNKMFLYVKLTSKFTIMKKDQIKISKDSEHFARLLIHLIPHNVSPSKNVYQ